MNFVSYSYAIFFAIVMAARLTIGRSKTEAPYVALIIATSALFYAWHIPSFLLILLASTVMDYIVGLALGARPPGTSPWPRRLLLCMSLGVNLRLPATF